LGGRRFATHKNQSDGSDKKNTAHKKSLSKWYGFHSITQWRFDDKRDLTMRLSDAGVRRH
jgi:hypothetical protein